MPQSYDPYANAVAERVNGMHNKSFYGRIITLKSKQ